MPMLCGVSKWRSPHLKVAQLLGGVRIGDVQQLSHVLLALLLLACGRRRLAGGTGAAIVMQFALLDADEVTLAAQQHRLDGVVQTQRGLVDMMEGCRVGVN